MSVTSHSGELGRAPERKAGTSPARQRTTCRCWRDRPRDEKLGDEPLDQVDDQRLAPVEIGGVVFGEGTPL